MDRLLLIRRNKPNQKKRERAQTRKKRVVSRLLQDGQALVDLARLPQHQALGLGFRHALAARQVDLQSRHAIVDAVQLYREGSCGVTHVLAARQVDLQP